MKKNNTCDHCPSRPVPSRMSLREALERAREQIEIEAFEPFDLRFAEELCLVMAEVYLMDSASRIRIGGEELDGHLVREVFGELSHEHVDLVMRNFKEVTATVKNKKAYLRASLYQSVFELESHYINRVSHDLGSQ